MATNVCIYSSEKTCYCSPYSGGKIRCYSPYMVDFSASIGCNSGKEISIAEEKSGSNI